MSASGRKKASSRKSSSIRDLVIVLGDQLDESSHLLASLDPDRDLVWMAEVKGESTHVWSSKMRTAVFLSAMRHFAARLADLGIPTRYLSLDDSRAFNSFGDALSATLESVSPERVLCLRPGEWRVLKELEQTCSGHDIPLEISEDPSFYSTPEDFFRHAEGRKQVRLEFFYRELRKRFNILMTEEGKPVGGAWNFDKSNRSAFPRSGPPEIPEPLIFPPDRITESVLESVEKHFADHPGTLGNFGWPVTRQQALAALEDFISNRLPHFGTWQDAMWTGEPWLFHSRISVALNLKLLKPAEAVDAAVRAFDDGLAPIEAVEGFVRQILGWREYVRGIYWWKMPGYLEMNHFGADRPLPAFFWNGDTTMTCLREAISQTLDHGYAHHIQRLMVTGLFCLLLGVDPKQVHQWYLAVYVDAVEWVELPNSLGMTQFADAGLMASKPYSASGKYIDRMSNYCRKCPYNPASSTGDDACPFTTLYWDFLIRHRSELSSIPRMDFQLRNLDRLSRKSINSIQSIAGKLKDSMAG